MRKRWRLILGIVLSALFVYLSIRDVDWAELWGLFSAGNYFWLIPAFLMLLVINYVRGYRWRLLMHPDTSLGLTKSFHYVNIGYLFNNILPAKAGEVVRTVLAGRIVSGGFGQAVSSLLIERLLDVLTLVPLLLVLIPILDLPQWATRGGLVFGVVAVAGTIALLVLARIGKRGVDWLWRFVGRIPLVGHPRIREMVDNLVEGFGVLWNRQVLPGVLISSLVIWGGYALFNYVIMLALRLSHLPFSAAALVLCTTGFSMIVPSSPGGIGPFEWAGVQALALFGVTESVAFGYTLGLHLFTILSMDLFGLVGLAVEGVNYADVRRQAEEQDTAQAAAAE